MTSFIIYSLEAAISLALFYSAYWLFLRNETFFRLNRIYLLASVAVALTLPLLNISVLTAADDSLLAKYITLPIEQYEQRISGESGNAMTRTKRRIIPGSLENTAITGPADPGKSNSVKSALSPALPLQSIERDHHGAGTSWLKLIFTVYGIGAALFFVRFMVNLAWILSYVVRYRSQQIAGMKVIRFERNLSPFSFLNFIFISSRDYPEAELNKIITHEKVHIRQKHSADLILFELLLVLQWFNPFVWFYKRAIKINHEYLADQGTLNAGVDMQGYQYSLLNQVLRENNFEVASNYNLSIKKRITMMMKKRSPKTSALKLIIALPILVCLFGAFAFNTTSSGKAVEHQPDESSGAFKKDTLRRVSVSAEYLRLLEGTYISTNEPNFVRRIRFQEVAGELMGNDNGYIYKLIPLGDEKFVNPDDGASFVFNTKDEQEITLLLFGKINLKKMVSPGTGKESLAYAVWEEMAKGGTTAMLQLYQNAKSSGKYYLSEHEMNYAGYHFLNSGKPSEAAAIFKLNTEEFPKSYNVYDSYGEALMALGEKALAIENYKKSVQLNPGSPSGIMVLKNAGVYSDTLIKKLPMDYLKLLEGEYITTRPEQGRRRITFKEEQGVLIGNDDGYKYKLTPVGDGKFINPDDGASLVFDTKNKNAVTMVLFGRIHLKKVTKAEADKIEASTAIKKVDVPKDYLQLLQGEYVSTNESNSERRIWFQVIDGKLVGNDNGYVYTIIPVGGEKFINPDDGASLVFDSKNKEAITLLLFGKISLKKIK